MATGGGSEATAQRILRITDIADEPLAFLAPISGYAKVALVSLEEAVEPLVSILPDVQSHAYVAKQRCENPADGLSQDESASIMLYTMGWQPLDECLYVVLNATLRSADRQEKLERWYLYLRLFLNALFRLPPLRETAYRGVKLDMSKSYIKGRTIAWWGFSSCTTTVEVLQSNLFLGETGTRTIFTIQCETARDIRKHSYYSAENEVLLLAATQFEVIGSLKQGDLRIVQLKETRPPHPLLQPVPIVIPTTNPSSTVQTMNTDQATYYSNLTGPHQAGIRYYISNGTDPQYSIGNPNTYVRTAHTPQQYYHPSMPNAFGPPTVYVPQPNWPHAPFSHTNGPPGMNPSSVPIVRWSNKNPNGSQNFISQTPYSTYSQPPTTYIPQQYPSYTTSYHYTQPTSPSQISNQSQVQYPGTTSHQQMQSSQSFPSSYPKVRCERKPLAIVDPVFHEMVKVETSTPAINASSTITTTDDTATDPTITNPKSTEEINETQKKQAEFRQLFARLLNNSDVQTDNSSNQSSTEKTTTKENQTEDPILQSTSPASLSRSGSISNQSSEQLQPSYSDSSIRRITDDKSDTETNAL